MPSQNRILSVLHEHGLIIDTHGWSIESSEGGLNNRVYFAVAPGGQHRFTVRTVGKNNALDREVEALTELQGCPGVPRLRLVIPEEFFVYDYAPGATVPLEQVNASLIVRLARCLACVHSQQHDTYTVWPATIPLSGARRDLFFERHGTLRRYGSYEQERWKDVDPRIKIIFTRLASHSLPGDDWDKRTFVQLHGDLSIGNIIWDDAAVTLIDWEYARWGDPAEDLAYLITEQRASREVADNLRTAYLEAGGSEEIWSRVPAYASLVALDSALWWVDYLIDNEIDPAGHTEVVQRIDTAWDWLEKPTS